MTQEQNVRTREEQLASYPQTVCVGQYPGKSWVLEIDVDDLDPDRLVEDAVSYVRADIAYNCERQAEARGAEEARRVDAETSLRPMSEAKKDRTPILAKIHDDLFPRIRPERADLKPWNGRWVVVSHPGIPEDGFDIGWGVAAPVGHGGFPDDWFVGWKPIECPANVAALEERVKVLEADQRKDQEVIHWLAEKLKQTDPEAKADYELLARAALTREGGE
ncbi:hypothetical protein AD945_06270 [Gluconobacter albidus]|uniref:Uncharacterized protein n=1 Tax=Gluconobacter albidus TaxID=318683 RepID=A0A149TK29_9PROT|nr:hypothetical protein [Gluconobacter albidus]KXV48751.1 hypothetical protein AD945_06270 [Gluconobacter albidus]